MGEPRAVLLVDDNRDLAENIAEILEGEGIACTIALDGESALEALRSGQFDLVVTDIRMPGMTGIQVLEAIRISHPDLPVIVMSAYANERSLAAAVATGAIAVLAKPVDIPRFIAMVRSAA